jgi:hypothetical protein
MFSNAEAQFYRVKSRGLVCDPPNRFTPNGIRKFMSLASASDRYGLTSPRSKARQTRQLYYTNHGSMDEGSIKTGFLLSFEAVFKLLYRPDRRPGHFSGHLRPRTRCTILKPV